MNRLGHHWSSPYLGFVAIADDAAVMPAAAASASGRPVGTIVRGAQVMWDGGISAAGTGRAVRFTEALAADTR